MIHTRISTWCNSLYHTLKTQVTCHSPRVLLSQKQTPLHMHAEDHDTEHKSADLLLSLPLLAHSYPCDYLSSPLFPRINSRNLRSGVF